MGELEEKQNMLFYASWLDIIEKAPGTDKEKYDLILSLLKKGLRNEKIETDNPLYAMFQQQAFAQIEVAQDKHKKRVEAGRLGGQKGKGVTRNKGNQNAKKQNNSKTIANDNENVNVNENDNKTFSLINNENDIDSSLGPKKVQDEPYMNARELIRRMKNENGVSD